MCLAIPMKVVRAEGDRGEAETGGVRRTVRLDLVEAAVGDYVLVHAGFAIQVLDEAEAAETLELLEETLGPVDWLEGP